MRSQALDLLGFTSQLVFSTFSLGLFVFSDDLDLVYGGAAAHNRMMSDFCAHDPRLIGVGFLPLNDPERSLKSLAEALELGCGALWVTHATSSGRSPSHVDNDPVWAAVQEAGVPIVMHIGGGRNAISKAWYRNGRPRPTDLHGGGENSGRFFAFGVGLVVLALPHQLWVQAGVARPTQLLHGLYVVADEVLCVGGGDVRALLAMHDRMQRGDRSIEESSADVVASLRSVVPSSLDEVVLCARP